ncbi:MAG TPA: arsenate reductase ArsC [Pyrinomonadaceae bacterium]|nr:arsenate reductase ArsC [Pyrinomonadaceae bacterium]
MDDRRKILILCTGNSARSQMAEGLLRDKGGNLIEAASAGVAPTRVRPEAILAMKEIGIDISNHRSKSVDELITQSFDYVITVCDSANELCPAFPGRCRRIHWSIDDPAAVSGDGQKVMGAFRRARDELSERLDRFIETEMNLVG